MFVIDGNGLGPLSEQKRKKTRIDIKDYKQKSSMKAGKKYMTDVICDKDNTNKLWSYIKSKGHLF
jgi:hypothetical protein